MDALETIINSVQQMRVEFAELEIRLERNEVLRRNIPLNDDYETVQATDYLSDGFKDVA